MACNHNNENVQLFCVDNLLNVNKITSKSNNVKIIPYFAIYSSLICFLLVSNFYAYGVTIEVLPTGNFKAGDPLLRFEVKIHGYSPSYGTVIVTVNDSSGNFIKETELYVRDRDGVWQAEMSISNPYDSYYELYVTSELGGYLGTGSLSLEQSPPPIISNTYHKTYLTLQVEYNSATGNIEIYPQLTDSSGFEINGGNLVIISIDEQHIERIPPNQWYKTPISAGSHTIRADVNEFWPISDPSIIYESSSDVVDYEVPGGGGSGMETSYKTYLTLKVEDGSTAGHIRIKPQLTTELGIQLNTERIQLYVDGNYFATISSNDWSEINTGTGLHTIKTEYPEGVDTDDPSITYLSSSDEKRYTVSGIIQPPLPPTPPIPPPSDGSAIVIVLVIVGAVGAGVGIALSKRKKKLPLIIVKQTPPLTKLDDTQFWVCPHCGKDTEMYSGKQYCRSCNVYL